MKNFKKYFTLEKEGITHYFLITLKKKYNILVSGVLGQSPIIEINDFENKEIAKQKVDAIILTKLEEDYKEVEASNELSVFSIAMELLKTEDVAQFEKGILILKKLVTIYYNRDKHPFVKFLGVKMKDESLVTVSILDEYLKKHIDKLSSSSLVSIFQMTLQNIYFNFEATSFVVEEIIKRKDLKAQLAVVKQFYKACEYYDAGHRFWSSTNQDELIDSHFPKFESEALLELLREASGDMLNNEGGDGMEELFTPALSNTEDLVVQQKILDVLEGYKKEYEEEGYVDEEYFDDLFENILEAASVNVKKGLEKINERKERRAFFLEAIEEVNLLKIQELLEKGIIPDKGLVKKIIEISLESKNLSIIKLCKEKGVQFNIEDLFNNPTENVEVLKECIESDIVDVTYISEKSNKNLLFFVSENKILLEALLKKGVDANHIDEDGKTILMRICSYARGDKEVYIEDVNLLLAYEANPNISVTIEGWEKGTTALHYAIENKAVEIAKLLINASVDVNAMRDNGNNPLMLAHKANNSELIDLLVKVGATAPEEELLKIEFLRCASQKQWDRILELEWDIVLAYPEDFTVVLRLAEAHYFSRSNYEQAANYSKKALQLEANNSSLNILFMSSIRLGKIQETIDVFLAYKKQFSPERILADNIIANLVVAYCASNQLKEGVEVLSPYFSKVEESRKVRGVMSFNIACMYALVNDTHEMLPYVISALEREYTKDDFLNESDFANYHSNELFLFILNQNHKENIELEECIEDSEENTFKKLSVKAFYNTGTFSFENEDHEFTYTTGGVGEKEKVTRRLYTSKAQALTVYFNKLKKMPNEDKNMYFLLKEDDSLQNKIFLEAPNQLDFLSGNKITASIDRPIVFTTNAKSGDVLLDFNEGEIPVMSKIFVDLLKEAGVDSLQTFPVLIKSKKDETVWQDYFAVNFLDVIACGAFPASLFKKNKPKHGIRCELAIDTEKVDDTLLFRLKEELSTVVLHRSVVKYLIDNDPEELVKWEFKGVIH